MRLAIISSCMLALLPFGAAHAFDTISPEEALKRAHDGQTVLVDVRTPEEWRETGVAPGAKALDMANPSFAADLKTVIDANPGKPLTFICRSGRRSSVVAGQMEAAGMSHIANVEGGMNAWLGKGLPVEKR
jgi:rhodanese-related sulfurtransferase